MRHHHHHQRPTARVLAALLASSLGSLAAPPCASSEGGANDGGRCEQQQKNEAGEEASLLQTRRDGEEWGGPTYYVQMAPPDKLAVPRTVLKEGFVREFLVRYPMSDQIKIDGKTATIDMHRMMTGTFSRDSTGEAAVGKAPFDRDYKDWGVEKGLAFVTPQSMISDKVKLAFAEKSHTMWVPDESQMLRNSETIGTANFNAQTEKQRKQAVKDRPARNGALSTLSLSLGGQILQSGKDFPHTDELRNYTKKHPTPMQSGMEDLDRMRQEMAERQAAYTAKIPLASTIGCLHFEGAELMTFRENNVTVPLDTNIVAWRGQLGTTPNDWYSMASGIAFFHHNEEDDSFEIFFRLSTAVDIVDVSTIKKKGRQEDNYIRKYAAAYIESPMNGDKKNKVGKDGRHKSFSISWFGTKPWKEAQEYEIDYSFLHSKREEVGCPDKVLNSLPENVGKFQSSTFHTGANGEVTVGMPSAGWHQTLLDEVNCAVEYLKPVDDSAIVAYGRLLAVGLLHVLIEMPGEVMVAAFSNSGMWNDFSLPLK